MSILGHFKRLIFVLAIMVGLLFLSGEGGGFIRFFVAGSCFLFAWGAWENWRDVLEVDEEEDGEYMMNHYCLTIREEEVR